MDDLTFLRNLARRGKVVLLADGAALPAPVSVMDDESRAGASFRINMVSPEMVESGDRRTFKAGSTDHRELPIPLMWQWQLDDGHKTAVVVGRIDSIERISGGLGNARGVFDTGPWGAEAERMVRNRMLRGVSGDYTNFDALVLEKVEDSDDRLLDDKINVQRSKLVAATIVAKPAFEGCWIEILEEDEVYPDGVTEAPAAITAAAFVAGGHSDLVDRLLKLEALEARWQDKQLAVTASAVRSRVESHRLQREREDAIARIRGKQNLTAAWKPLSSAFLSAKAKLQPRDSKGRWIEMGSMVRWLDGIQIGGDKPNAKSGATPGGKTYRHGRVVSYNPKSKKYTVQATDGRNDKVELEGKNLEVVQALIPDTPEEAQAYADSVAKDRLERGDSEMNRKDEEHFAREQREGKFVRPEDDDGIEPATGMTEAEEDTLKRAKDRSLQQVPFDPDAEVPLESDEQRRSGEAAEKAMESGNNTPAETLKPGDKIRLPLPGTDGETEDYEVLRNDPATSFSWVDGEMVDKQQQQLSLRRASASGEYGDEGYVNVSLDEGTPVEKIGSESANEKTEPDVDATTKSADTFLDLVTQAGGIEGMDEYIDEVKNGGPAGRSPGQFDSMKELLDANEERFTDREWNEINAAFQGMKKDVLDSPGEETIESLDRPAPKTALPEDLPDPTDDALTVPADWKISNPDDPSVPQDPAGDVDLSGQDDLPEPDDKTVAGRLISKFDASQRNGADWAVPKDPAKPEPSDIKQASELAELLRTKGIDAVAFMLFERYNKDPEGAYAWLSEWTQNRWREIAENIFKKGDPT